MRWPAVDRGLHSHPYGYRTYVHTHACADCGCGMQAVIDLPIAMKCSAHPTRRHFFTFFSGAVTYCQGQRAPWENGIPPAVAYVPAPIRLCTVFLTAHFAQNLTMATSTCGFYDITITSSTKCVQLAKSLKLQQKSCQWFVPRTGKSVPV